MNLFRTLFGRSTTLVFIDAADPLVAKNLGITDLEWSSIRQQAVEEAGWVVMDAEKVSSSVIEIRFKKSEDRTNDQGGIFHRYEKKHGVWKRSPIIGNWAVGYSPT